MRKLLTFLIALGTIVFAVVSPVSAQVGFVFTQPFIGGPHISGSPTTVISTTLTTNDSGDNGFTARTLTPTPLLSGDLGQTTVTFLGPAAGAACTHSSIGIWSGTGTNTVSTPVELKWSGASGPTLGANQVLTSDPVAGLGYTTGSNLIVICDISTSAAKISTTSTGWANITGVCSTLTGVSWNAANVTATCGNSTNAGWSVMVQSIQTSP